jgi:hypothetical protein
MKHKKRNDLVGIVGKFFWNEVGGVGRWEKVVGEQESELVGMGREH